MSKLAWEKLLGRRGFERSEIEAGRLCKVVIRRKMVAVPP